MFMTRIGFGLGLGLSLALVAGGCDGAVGRGPQGGGGAATIDGTIGGASLGVMDSFSATTKSGSSQGGSAAILFTSTPGVCAAAGRGEQPKNVTGLTLLVFATDANAKSIEPTATGTYAVTKGTPAANSRLAIAVFGATDDQCKSKMFKPADSGKVEVTRIDANGYAGTFDLVFGSDHVSGSFDVPECGGASTAAAGSLTCV
jgi:hypothetical protein